jgi:5-methylcytosine-specific restriction enzyme B
MLSGISVPSGRGSSPCWFVGAMTGGVDQTNRFIDEGLWEHDFGDNSRVLAQVRSMQTGERIAIKAAYIKKHGLPFENWGNTVSVMAIKATGVIAENMGDGRRLRVHWQRVSPAREWYFYTYQPTIWKVIAGDWKTDALIDFAFQNKPQDFVRFCNDPFWRERFGTDPRQHRRFRWARFYQAIADGLISHRTDRRSLIEFLQQLQPSVEGLGLLSSDQFADGSRGFIQDIDPFTLFGLFNRGISGSNRQSIAAAIAQFLGVQEPVPENFDGIPVLNNQNSWFFPYAKSRDPAQIDALWQVFQSGLDLAEADTEQAIDTFSRDFDAAIAHPWVAWNLTFGLYWCRPWSFLSLDGKVRNYVSEKLRLPIGRNGPKGYCSAADYLALINALQQRFDEPDFIVHSFPELSLEAWNYTGTTPEPDDEPEGDDGIETGGDDTPEVEPVTPVTPYGIDTIVADGCFLPHLELERILSRFRDKKNLILQGPPGTGKTWLARRLGMALVGQVEQEPQLRSVQFHPNLSYEDFVRGWRPGGDGGLSLHEGVFMQMVKAALEHPGQSYVLVIEEINRGNPAQIFGELLTLLEAGRRTPRDAMQLCYPDPDGTHRPVYVPENMFLIGTMNIADRSLALVDMAFWRRFAFIDLEPCLGETWREWVVTRQQMDPTAAATIEQRLGQLNAAIAADRRLGKAFQIGHSYVTPTLSLEGRSTRDWFAEVVASELKPLLKEYWFDAPDEAEQQTTALLDGW